MSSIELGDAYERHEFLPLAVNWLGEWNNQTVYFENDVVVSPLTTASYIMVGPQTTQRGGADPSINNTNWFQYGSSIDTVQNIRGGDGITFVGSDFNPVVKNTGVISVIAGDGFTNVGTEVDPILACETLTAIVPGLGIDIPLAIPTPTIINTGVTDLRAGSGINAGRVGGVVYLDNTAIDSLTAAPTNPGLTVSPGLIKTIVNTGLLSVITGNGITNTGTTTNPNLRNNGVITLRPLNESILISGNAAVPSLSSNIPRKTPVWIPNASTVPNKNGNLYRMQVTQVPGLWADCLANGVPYSTGFFMIPFPFSFLLNVGEVLISNVASISLYDGITDYSFPINTIIFNTLQPGNKDAYYTIGTVEIDLQAIRAIGFRQLTHIQYTTAFNAKLKSIGGPVFATYQKTISGIIISQ